MPCGLILIHDAMGLLFPLPGGRPETGAAYRASCSSTSCKKLSPASSPLTPK